MIDWARVDDLQSEIGADDFLEVVDMFLEEADDVISRLTGAPDPSQIESRLHFLKGSALNLGLTDLAALCQTGERAAAAGSAASVDLAEVAVVYQASRASLVAALATKTASP